MDRTICIGLEKPERQNELISQRHGLLQQVILLAQARRLRIFGVIDDAAGLPSRPIT
jgi:hypothetical protein